MPCNRPGIERAMSGCMCQSFLVDQAAELLGVSRRTIYYRIRDGRLRTIRTPGGSQRVLMESIELMLRQGVRQARVPVAGAPGRVLSQRYTGL
jgi:excisionase family DNA binding protein